MFELKDDVLYVPLPEGKTQAELIEAARSFFAEKGLTAGQIKERAPGIYYSYQLHFYDGKQGMWLIFDPPSENDNYKAGLEIFITTDFEILSYSLH